MAFADKICMKKGRENSMSPLDIAYISYMNCWYSPTELYDYIKTDGATIKISTHEGILSPARNFQGVKYISSTKTIFNGKGEYPTLMVLPRESYDTVINTFENEIEGD